MKRVYKVEGVRFVQRPMTYAKWERLRELTRGKRLGSPEWTPEGIGAWVDRAMEERVLPRLMAEVVLDLYEPTALHRWLNDRALARSGKTVEAILSGSTELAGVIADFFFLNVSWWQKWLNTPRRSGWLRRGTTPGRMMASLARASLLVAEETSPKPRSGGRSRR